MKVKIYWQFRGQNFSVLLFYFELLKPRVIQWHPCERCGNGSWCCLYPQRSGSSPGTFRETTALQPSQVQLLPLRAGSVRQTRPAGGDRENQLRWICWKGKSEFSQNIMKAITLSAAYIYWFDICSSSFTCTRLMNILLNLLLQLKIQMLSYNNLNRYIILIDVVLSCFYISLDYMEGTICFIRYFVYLLLISLTHNPPLKAPVRVDHLLIFQRSNDKLYHHVLLLTILQH